MRFTLELYKKYRRNLDARRALLGVETTWGEERELLLEEIDEADFYRFLESFNGFMLKMADDLC